MSPSHLIIVCGHAIWLGGPKNGWDEAEWLIESYKQGETPTFIEHIKAGVRLLGEDDTSVLVFSGCAHSPHPPPIPCSSPPFSLNLPSRYSLTIPPLPTSAPTRPETQLSEARSYYNLAVANSFFHLLPKETSSHDLLLSTARIILEERALDSYYNILFSLVAFWRHHARWPARLTIVSHAFKRDRLVDGHCAAIGFPLERVAFVGINPPGVDGGVVGEPGGGGKAEAMKGVQLAMGQWEEDPHGVGEELAGKRRGRNCWGVQQGLFWGDEERERSGVDVRVLEDGSEALVDGGRRPWRTGEESGSG